MAKCIYKEEVSTKDPEHVFYMNRCTWGNSHIMPTVYRTDDHHMQFVYLDPGDCKGCQAKKTSTK